MNSFPFTQECRVCKAPAGAACVPLPPDYQAPIPPRAHAGRWEHPDSKEN